MDNETIDKLIDTLQGRIKFHEENIERWKTYGKMFQDDIFISEGQIMEDKVMIEILFNMTTNQ